MFRHALRQISGAGLDFVAFVEKSLFKSKSNTFTKPNLAVRFNFPIAACTDTRRFEFSLVAFLLSRIKQFKTKEGDLKRSNSNQNCTVENEMNE